MINVNEIDNEITCDKLKWQIKDNNRNKITMINIKEIMETIAIQGREHFYFVFKEDVDFL
jgi:hypothetical protein